MPWRFRRTIRILPGVKLNFSKSGVSTSVGKRGAHVTVGHGKVRTTVGVPGTGVSYTTTTTAATPAGAAPAAHRRRAPAPGAIPGSDRSDSTISSPSAFGRSPGTSWWARLLIAIVVIAILKLIGWL